MTLFFHAKEHIPAPDYYRQRLVGPCQLIHETDALWVVRYANSSFFLQFLKADWNMEHVDGLDLPFPVSSNHPPLLFPGADAPDPPANALDGKSSTDSLP